MCIREQQQNLIQEIGERIKQCNENKYLGEFHFAIKGRNKTLNRHKIYTRLKPYIWNIVN